MERWGWTVAESTFVPWYWEENNNSPMTSNLDVVSNGLSKRLKEYAVRTDELGRRLIQKSLATSPDPWAAINKLQSELSLGVASSNYALQFLSFLGVSNLEAHTSLFESLKEKIELVVMRLPESHLQMLLKETAVLLTLKELKIIPLSVIKRLSNIPPQYLKLLIERGLLQVFISPRISLSSSRC